MTAGYLDGSVLVHEAERRALAANVDVGAGGLGPRHLQGGGLGGGHQQEGEEQLAVHGLIRRAEINWLADSLIKRFILPSLSLSVKLTCLEIPEECSFPSLEIWRSFLICDPILIIKTTLDISVFDMMKIINIAVLSLVLTTLTTLILPTSILCIKYDRRELLFLQFLNINKHNFLDDISDDESPLSDQFTNK